MRIAIFTLLTLILSLFFSNAFSIRIKDITTLKGVRDNQLIGYGLVVGLDGTGDKVNQTTFTQQTFKNMLLQFGIRLPVGANMQLQNVAAVAVSATLHPFLRIGQKMDVTVSSLGNASSLRGGELLMTPLRGADGQIYAISQGSVIISGFGAQGGDGSKVIVNSTSTGRIPNGATVEKIIDMPFVEDGAITFEITEPDFTTAERIEQAINHEIGRKVARALDASAVIVRMDYLPYEPGDTPLYRGDVASYKEDRELTEMQKKRMKSKYVPYISRIENIVLEPAKIGARVIVNSRTGTIVLGQEITISPVAVSHGNLSVVISETPFVSQPQGFSNGKTVVGTASTINVHQSANRAFVFAPGASLNDLVDAINNVGAAPGDLIAILEAIKSAGALHADLEVI